METSGLEPDRIALTRQFFLGARPGGPTFTAQDSAAESTRRVALFDAAGTPVGSLDTPGLRGSFDFSSVAAPVFGQYAGPKQYAVAYNPTWPNWAPTANTQLFDSDFFNDAFKGLWGTDNTGQGRNDLATIQSGGFNLVRLYNWSPTRGANDSAHLSFLDKANDLGMHVIVPVSDYFLGSDQYAWGSTVPANNDFSSAPVAIQNALNDFIKSITENGAIHPAVHSISVGNELDLGIDNDPGTTAKLQRTLWWVVNLQAALSQIDSGSNHPLLTIPISNGDQGAWAGGMASANSTTTTLQRGVNPVGPPPPPWQADAYAGMVVKIVAGTGTGQARTITSNSGDTLTVSEAWATVPDATSGFVVESPNPRSWYEIFDQGVTSGERVPIGSVPAGPTGRFTSDVSGLAGYSWYKDWFYNSINTFQELDGLKNQLVQYDTGLPSGNGFAWSQQWPGTKLSVPLLLTELGFSRFNIGADAQSNVVANNQAQVATNVLMTSDNLMGYTIFEFNDEPNKNGYTGGPASEVFFGINTYNASQSGFRNGSLLYNLQTGTTPWAGGTLPSLTYPVYQLTPVPSGATTLMNRLKGIFSQVH